MASTDINVKLVDQTKAGFRQINSNLKGLQGQTSSLTSGFVKLGAAIAGSFAVKGIVDTASKFQDLRTSLQLLMKDSQAGAEAFDNIKKFATSSIFSVEQLTETFIKLKAAGIQPTTELLNTFQDTAAITADSVGALQAITDLFARTTAGGLGLEELNRLADRGIPVFDILSEKIGVSRLEISDLGKSAQGAQKILTALQDGLNERFGGAVEGRMNNVSQAFNNLGDAIDNASDAIGQGGLNEALADAATTITKFITENQEGFKEFGSVIGKAITLVIDNIALLTAAFVAFISAAAVSKIIAIAEAFGVLNGVLSKNIFVKLAVGAISLGTGLYTYFKLGGDEAEKTAEKVKEVGKELKEVAKTSNDGQNLAEVLKLQTAGLSAELASLTQKYDASNQALRKKIELETEAIGRGQSQLDLSRALGDAEAQLTNQRARIQEKINKIQNDAGKGAQFKAEATKQLLAAEQVLIKSTQEQKEALTELLTIKQKEIELDQLKQFGIQQQLDLQDEIRAVQDEIAQITMTEIEKKHYDIARAARESAQMQVDAYKRLKDAANEPYDQDIIDGYYEAANRGLEELHDLTDEHYQMSRTWEAGWETAFKRYVENATNASAQAEAVFDTAVRGMEDILFDFITKGELNWKTFTKSIVDEILKAEISKAVASVFSFGGGGGGGGDFSHGGGFGGFGIGDVLGSVFGGGGSSGSGGGFMEKAGTVLGDVASGIGDFFGGFFAKGGYLPAGQIGIAGERGPELIGGPTQVTPLSGMGGGSTTVNYNINAVDARSFQELLASDPQSLYALSERGRMSMAGAR